MAITFKLPEANDTIFRGDTVVIQMTITEDDIPMNLTGYSVWFTMKKVITDADAATGAIQKTVGSGIVLLDTVNGLIEITIAPGDTAPNDGVQKYEADVQIKHTASGKIETVARGTITFEPDITRAS